MDARTLRILIVEDSPQDLEILRDLVESLGHVSVCARKLDAARRALSEDARLDIVISDICLPDGSGADLVEIAAAGRPVILITAYGEVEAAVEAMRRGAFHYLAKPLRREELEVLLARAAAAITTTRELTRLRDLEGLALVEADMVVRSPAMRAVMEMAHAAAATDATILLLGESGTGKEIVARAIHRMSPRSQGPLVAVHCGAIPASLLEADLFGHEKGSFTGATSRRIGKFERAHGGTLFLDEIGTMPMELQSRLLRAIQEREVERIGGDHPIRVDFRLIAATNCDLVKAVAEGTFREDLYYRLNVVPLRLPPLRERREEIPALVARFLSARNSKSVTVEPAAMERFIAHAWPGNIRELENAVERALILSGWGPIHAKHLPSEIHARKENLLVPAAEITLEKTKRLAVESALRSSKGRRDIAAAALGIHRNTLRKLIRRYGIKPE